MQEFEIGKSRLEAFSDGLIAIIVTIMVLELKVPHHATLENLANLSPVLLSYALSFLVVSIMWVNHHHIIHTVRKVDGQLLWTNINLLFWMSLIPFVTGLLGESEGAALPTALYGADLTMCATGFFLLRKEIAKQHTHIAALAANHEQMLKKNVLSVVIYALSMPLAYVSVYLSYFIFILIPAMYFMPDKSLPFLAGDDVGKQPHW
jgi:uncharacterized membrane protein